MSTTKVLLDANDMPEILAALAASDSKALYRKLLAATALEPEMYIVSRAMAGDSIESRIPDPQFSLSYTPLYKGEEVRWRE